MEFVIALLFPFCLHLENSESKLCLPDCLNTGMSHKATKSKDLAVKRSASSLRLVGINKTPLHKLILKRGQSILSQKRPLEEKTTTRPKSGLPVVREICFQCHNPGAVLTLWCRCGEAIFCSQSCANAFVVPNHTNPKCKGIVKQESRIYSELLEDIQSDWTLWRSVQKLSSWFPKDEDEHYKEKRLQKEKEALLQGALKRIHRCKSVKDLQTFENEWNNLDRYNDSDAVKVKMPFPFSHVVEKSNWRSFFADHTAKTCS